MVNLFEKIGKIPEKVSLDKESMILFIDLFFEKLETFLEKKQEGKKENGKQERTK